MSSIPLKKSELETLKVKRVSLALESNYIRLRELHYREDARAARIKRKLDRSKAFDETRHNLYQHRRDVVRPEARAANIAHAYLKGYKYEHVENSFHVHRFGVAYRTAEYGYNKTWQRVIEIVSKFGGIPIEDAETMILSWRDEHPQLSGIRRNINKYTPSSASKEERHA